jgi:uncharacterized protein (TIGR03790 family)
MTIHRILSFLIIAVLLSLPAPVARAGGDEVLVIYNSKLPESKALAMYYARKRDVPKEQVLGLALTENETMSRAEFRNDLQRPLLKELEAQKLWQLGRGDLPSTNNTRVNVFRKVVQSKIRYLVLCYGVPLKIRRDGDLREPAAEKMRPELRRNEAAVDSELACLPWQPQGYTLAGPNINLLYATTNAAALHPTNGVLIVARIDAATESLARGLVDKALEAEANGLWGRAYFDLRSIADPGYKMGDDWIRAASQMALQAGFDTVVDEKGDTFPAAFPMSQIALYQGWYRESVSGPFVAPTVEFMPGAFAYHLHSFSAASLRNTNHNWVGPLLAKGATCTMGCVDEPYLAGTPDVATFTGRWLFLGFTFGEAACAAQSVLSWQTTVVGDPLYQPLKKPLQELHLGFVAQTNQLVEWSTLRLINLNRLQGMSLVELSTVLENTPVTKESAVLTEKLAELYLAQGKPASAILMSERALTLNPTPQQRIRLRTELGDRLIAANRKEDAQKNYEQLLVEAPHYADAAGIRQKIAALNSKSEKKTP